MTNPTRWAAADHELGFLSLLGPNRDRFAAMMKKSGQRKKVLDKIAHANPFPVEFLVQAPANKVGVEDELVRRGSPPTCYVISPDTAVDRGTFDIAAALKQLDRAPAPFVLSCIPGELLYYRSESPNADSWLVVNTSRSGKRSR